MNNIDKQGLFQDFNFKLVVVDALLDQKPAFITEFKTISDKYCSIYEWYSEMKPIPAVCHYLENLHIEQDDLDKVTTLSFCAGNDIYFYLQPDFDGEDDHFDVTSINGFEHLHNLKIVFYSSIVDEKRLIQMKEKGIIID